MARPPYEIGIYEGLIRRVKEAPHVSLRPFTDAEAAPRDRARLFVRHDIDTADCATNMAAALQIDLALGVSPGVYLRVDDAEYRAGSLRPEVADYRTRRFEFGLHTTCYLQDDALTAFRRETEKFADELGFRPTSFTVHGLGAFRYPERAKFQQAITQRLGEFGYLLTDCEGSARPYSYVIEDCHWDAEAHSRFIYEDFQALPPILVPGGEHLILTHPCYWRFAGGAS